MRVLVASNYYPPDVMGGYELACRDVVRELAARGHRILVVSGVPRRRLRAAPGVQRILPFKSGPSSSSEPWPRILWSSFKEGVRSLRVRALARRFDPHVLYLWNMGNVPVSCLAALLEGSRRVRVADIFDTWPVSLSRREPRLAWARRSARLPGLAFSTLGCVLRMPLEVRLRLDGAVFRSEWLRASLSERGFEVGRSEVIPGWVPEGDYFPAKPTSTIGRDHPVRVLYVGHVSGHKGVETAIEAIACLRGLGVRATLTIVGDGPRQYRHRLEERAAVLRVAGDVRFAGWIGRDELPQRAYRRHDVLVFPSRWPEPFGLTQVEAMACGLPVVGTATGGAAEVLEDGVNGLVHPPGDARQCAAALARLVADPDLYRRIRERGLEDARGRFARQHVLERTIRFLEEMAERRNTD